MSARPDPASTSRTGIRFDAGRHPRAKIGYVLLATEQTVQDDVMRLRPEGVGVHFARVPIADSITTATLAAEVDHLADAAATLLPDGSLDVVCYACTSGSLVIGEERVFAELARGAPGARTTSLITGVLRALRALDARRVVVATPYLDEINVREAAYLEQAGFDVLDIQGLDLERDSDMVRVAPDYIAEFAAGLDRPEADALFVSCGALRTLDVVQRLEDRLAKPVVCSNQAMIWDCLRLAGIEDRVAGYGTLLAAR
ncbi:MAG: arylmalonate decarboxylase [Gammaproteobacteria bacterium]|nr:arylmalonate decarboxylase [Gammaproteobacteria bacterium]